MFLLKKKFSFIKCSLFSLLFLFLALTFFDIYFESDQTAIYLYLTISFFVLSILGLISLMGRFLCTTLKSLKTMVFVKDDKNYRLNLSHVTSQVIDVKSWHDKNANSYTEIWLKTPNNNEALIKLFNSGVAVRKSQTLSVVYDKREAVAIYNHATNSIHSVNNRNNVLPSWLNSIVLFVMVVFSFLFLGVIGFISLPLVIIFLAKRKMKTIRHQLDWEEINSYLKMTKLV